MKLYNDLSLEEKILFAELAKKYMLDHNMHVTKLISCDEKAIDPSGSDLFHPELWKSGHWKWFVSLQLL